ncbi:MAG: response regulator [Saprospiraceae bacterium]
MGTKIFIYEDNTDRREGLKSLIQMYPDLVCVGAASNCANVEADLRKADANFVLMDIDMPLVNGIEGLKIIKKNYPGVKVLIQTVFDENEKIFECFKYGADGYILKKDSPAKLIEAIKEVMAGGTMMTPSIAYKVTSHFRLQQADDESKNLLTVKEKEVLKYLSEGYSYKMAAAEMNISYSTVNSHVKKIYEKLQVHSMGEAISYALKGKWFE